MLFSLAIVIITAFLLASLFERLKLPGLLGMMLAGILLGPYLSDKLLAISSELRTLALIIILIRAGLGINRQTLNKIGKSVISLSIIPLAIEAAVIFSLGHFLLGFPIIEALIFAFVISAVSPAVIVPQMLGLKEKGLGQQKEVPTLILAASSVDDVIAITLFSSMIAIALGKSTSILYTISSIPISIILGIIFGIITAFLFLIFLKKFPMRDTKKVLIFLAIAILVLQIEKTGIILFASLISIMTMGFVILEKNDTLAKSLAGKFNKIWVFAEILLFVLIGAAVDLTQIWKAGAIGLLIIALGLCGRSLGVLIALFRSNLNAKEKLFCTIAYLPKATVQAAIGAIPLSLGLASGNTILAIAVLSIAVTAPLGAIGIHILTPICLKD